MSTAWPRAASPQHPPERPVLLGADQAPRHRAATLMLNAGVPITTVSRRLGHAGPQVTISVYSHVVGTDAKDAADRLGRVIFGNGLGNHGSEADASDGRSPR